MSLAKTKRCLILNLTCLFLHVTTTDCCIRFWTSSENRPWEPVQKSDHWWKKMHEYFVETSETYGEEIDILFYGDSLTQGWSKQGFSTFDKLYIPLGAVNYGINADRTEHLLWRIQNKEVNKIKPKVVILMIGTNNMAHNTDIDIAKGIYTIVHELRVRLPLSKILLLGILPKGNSEAIMNRINAINFLLSLLNDQSMIRYLDMKEYFYKEKKRTLHQDLYERDLLHLSSKGYEKWSEIMNPLLQEMLN